MHTYIRVSHNGDHLYVVGHHHPTDGTWRPQRDCPTEAEAAKWASFLNGGTEPASPEAVS